MYPLFDTTDSKKLNAKVKWLLDSLKDTELIVNIGDNRHPFYVKNYHTSDWSCFYSLLTIVSTAKHSQIKSPSTAKHSQIIKGQIIVNVSLSITLITSNCAQIEYPSTTKTPCNPL